MKILVTTYPFGDPNSKPKELLKDFDIEYNTLGREYEKEETLELVKKHNPEIIIAGTEKYDAEVLDNCTNLKLISRVGIGVDAVDLEECKKRGIIVTNTPEAPSNAVAEMTVCQMINMLRNIQNSDKVIRDGKWDRYIGKELRSCNVGIFGCGRIGKLMVGKLQGLKPRRIFVNDIIQERAKDLPRSEYETKMQILTECDIITIHIPLNKNNKNFITKDELELMKDDAILINTSRGGIINEEDLYEWLVKNPKAKAAVDTFQKEPYKGKLIELDNAYLTPHLGSCSLKSRFDMEVGSVEEVLNYMNKKEFNSRVV
ncbi:hypothetical protein GF336_01930 [Candidatus Woesearchaeota archaeon]|nr:hypothetical protein [Candidatus Woesearchaeota archaeon]